MGQLYPSGSAKNPAQCKFFRKENLFCFFIKLEGSQGRETSLTGLSPPLGGSLREGKRLDRFQSSLNAYVMKKNHDWSGSMYIEIQIENQNEFEPACRIIDEAFSYPNIDIGYMILDTDYLIQINEKRRTNVRKN